MGLQKRYSKKEADGLLAASTHKHGDRVAIIGGWCDGSVGQVVNITLSMVYRGRLRYEVKIDGAPLGFLFYPEEIGPPPL